MKHYRRSRRDRRLHPPPQAQGTSRRNRSLPFVWETDAFPVGKEWGSPDSAAGAASSSVPVTDTPRPTTAHSTTKQPAGRRFPRQIQLSGQRKSSKSKQIALFLLQGREKLISGGSAIKGNSHSKELNFIGWLLDGDCH